MLSDRLARLIPATGLAAALALSAFAYARVIHGYFFADDFLYLYRAANAPVLDLVLTPHAGHLLVVRNAFYLLFRLCFGVEPSWYFAAVLVTHLANVALLFAVLQRLVGIPALAAFGAGLWGTLPSHAATLEWFAVYGQATAATALLAVLWSAAALGDRTPRPAQIGAWYLLALVSATSFGVGLGMALALPLALPLIAPGAWSRGRRVPVLSSLLLVLPALYVALQLYARWGVGLELNMAVPAQLPDPQSTAAGRGLLSGMSDTAGSGFAGDVAALYVQPAVLSMFARLALKGMEETVFGLFGPSRWTLGPLSAVAGLSFVACAVLAGRKPGRSRCRVIAFALLAGAGYAIIALGRARELEAWNLERQVLHPRYQYLTSLPLVMIWCVGLAELGRLAAIPPAIARALLAVWCTAVVARLSVAPLPIDLHDRMRSDVEKGLRVMRTSIVASPPGATAVLAPLGFNFNAAFIPAPLLPGWIALFTIFFPDDTVDGHHVVFAVSDPKLLEATGQGRRTATLVRPVQSGEASADGQ